MRRRSVEAWVGSGSSGGSVSSLVGLRFSDRGGRLLDWEDDDVVLVGLFGGGEGGETPTSAKENDDDLAVEALPGVSPAEGSVCTLGGWFGTLVLS